MTISAPSPGQLVQVRRRQFIVQDVHASGLLRSDLARPQHRVRMSSIEEDSLGEELEVVWEIEPGASILHGASALPEPTGLDRPDRFDAFLDAVRWGAIDSGDPDILQSPFRAGIQIEDYQLDPVARALRMPRVNLLIADDVGLGKTIEAGLVVEEMMLRHRVRTVFVVTPASVQTQWRDQMRDKFGLEFRIVDTELLRDLRRRRGVRTNPWTHFPRLIVSIDFLKREENLRRLREVLPAQPKYPRPFDLLIVDEAHNVAPTRLTRYSVDSDRTRAIRALQPHFEHRLFLTATPHNGFRESWSALLALLDDQRFAPGVPPDPAQVQQVVIRRLKSEIDDKDGNPRFPRRQLVHLEIDHPASERQAHEWLARYQELRLAACNAATGDGVLRTATVFLGKLLKKRLFSSPQAFLTTLQAHRQTLLGKREPAERRASVRLLRRELERVEDDFADDQDLEAAVQDGVQLASRQFDALSAEERALLERLEAWAAEASKRPDAKAQQLLAHLRAICQPGGDWNDERVIVFTEYRTTQRWLHGVLVTAGLGTEDRLVTLHGGVDQEERDRIKAAFQAAPSDSPVRILLATDAASEGIDLQNHCHRIVHYEIPWNPNRLEQRNGRVDRHGQRHAPEIHHFVPKGFASRLGSGDWRRPGDLEGDLEFLAVAARKVESIREDLGSVGAVLTAQIEEAMFGRREALDTGSAESTAKEVRRSLTFARKVKERIGELHEQLANSRQQLRVAPDHVQQVVATALELAGQPPLQPARLDGAPGARVFRVPELRPPWDRCLVGLSHPHSGKLRPVTFDHDVVVGRDDVVLVHLEHPLVRMATRLLRAEVWSTVPTAGRQKLHRVTARTVPSALVAGPTAIAHGRIVVLGGGNHALHEEVIAAGGTFAGGRFTRLNVGQVEELLAARQVGPVAEDRLDELRRVWVSIGQSVTSALEQRMRDRTRSLDTRMRKLAEDDVVRITTVLQELGRSIRKELDEASGHRQQLLQFAEVEREQYERDHDELQRRLAAIPGEIEAESKRIRERFEDPRPLLFPVSVTWLLPAGGER
jgi:superfamily II DNA or RNA helicase